jgi:Cdc6-like AAA superfamily ATPase
MTAEEWQQLAYEAGKVFTPSAPISEKDLFAGRIEQLREVVDTVYQTGQHAIIYGERGVGKTSLANIIVKMFNLEETPAIRINADGSDNYHTLWHKIFEELKVLSKTSVMGFERREELDAVKISQVIDLDSEISPDVVRQTLSFLASVIPLIIIIDEFDRIHHKQTRSAISDTIKNLSDHAVNVTLILVGVADSVDQLIEEHQSIERAIRQIQMPRMSQDERDEIIDKGLQKLNMTIGSDAKIYISSLSQGLPHYIHSVALNATREAIDKNRKAIDISDVDHAIEKALRQAQQSTITLYHKAVSSSKRKTIFAQVLLACALARTDSLGFFTASDVIEPLSNIMGKTYSLAAFAKHLKDFSTNERGKILQQKGTRYRFRFRFTNPLMQPYIVMKGIKDELITKEILG